MSILLNGKTHELSWNPGFPVALTPKAGMNGLLTYKLVHPVVSIIVADQESLFYVVSNAWQLVFAGAITILLCLFFVAAVELYVGVLIDTLDVHLIQLLQ